VVGARVVTCVRLAVLAGSSLLALWIGWPAVKNIAHSVTIPVRERPASAGPFAVERTALELPGPIAEGGGPVRLSADVWSPVARDDYAPSVRSCCIVVQAPRRPLSGTAEGAYPLLIYAPGWNGRRNDNHFLAGQLASFGYVVVAIDDIGATAAEAAKYGEFDLTSEAGLARSRAAADLRLGLMVKRVSALIDWLRSRDEQVGGQMRARIDFNRIGFVGFSFGGAVAAEATLDEPRLKAVANMDGWHFGRSATIGVTVPYLIINSDYRTLEQDLSGRSVAKRLTAELTLSDRALQMRAIAAGSAAVVLFRDTRHEDFTDDLFAPSLAAYIRHWNRDGAARIRLHASIASHLLQFFDRHLYGFQAGPREMAALDGVWPVVRLGGATAMGQARP
jgi:predicted dienelactone hydrolase